MKDVTRQWLQAAPGTLRQLQLGDTILEITNNEGEKETVDVPKLSPADAKSLFSKDGFAGSKSVTLKLHRDPDEEVSLPMEILRSVAASKTVVVGIFKTDEDFTRTINSVESNIHNRGDHSVTTVTCDPTPASIMNASIKMAEDASRFLVHPASGKDLNWFAAFDVGMGGKVQLIGNTIHKPEFTNKKPFSEIKISANMKDILVSQDPKANEENSAAISLNLDKTNRTADYEPLVAFIQSTLPSDAKIKSKVSSLRKGSTASVLGSTYGADGLQSEEKDPNDLDIVMALQNDGTGVRPLGKIIDEKFEDLRDSDLMLPDQLTEPARRGAGASKVTLLSKADMKGNITNMRTALLTKVGEYQHKGAHLVLVPKSMVSATDQKLKRWSVEAHQQIGFSVADEAKDGYPIVSEVAVGSVASHNKLKVGDLILEFQGSTQNHTTIEALQGDLLKAAADAVSFDIKIRSIVLPAKVTKRASMKFASMVDKESPGAKKAIWSGSSIKAQCQTARLATKASAPRSLASVMTGAEKDGAGIDPVLIVSKGFVEGDSGSMRKVKWAFRAEADDDCDLGFEIGVVTEKQVKDMRALSAHGVTGFSEIGTSVLPRPPLGCSFRGEMIQMELKWNEATDQSQGQYWIEYKVGNMPSFSQPMHLENWPKAGGNTKAYLAVTLYPGQSLTFMPESETPTKDETMTTTEADGITLDSQTLIVTDHKSQRNLDAKSGGGARRTAAAASIRLGDKIVAVDGDHNLDAYTIPSAVGKSGGGGEAVVEAPSPSDRDTVVGIAAGSSGSASRLAKGLFPVGTRVRRGPSK